MIYAVHVNIRVCLDFHVKASERNGHIHTNCESVDALLMKDLSE